MKTTEISEVWREYARAYNFFNPPSQQDVHIEIAKKIGNGRILDLGCGVGKMLRHLEGFSHYTGLDISPQMLEVAIEKYGKREDCDFAQLNAVSDELGIPVSSIDGVVMNNVLYALEKRENALSVLSKIRDVMKPKGLLAITTLNSEFSPEKLIEMIEEECLEQAKIADRDDMYRTFVRCNRELAGNTSKDYRPLLIDPLDATRLFREVGFEQLGAERKILGNMGELYFCSKQQ